jgi:hypothetical protein
MAVFSSWRSGALAAFECRPLSDESNCLASRS